VGGGGVQGGKGKKTGSAIPVHYKEGELLEQEQKKSKSFIKKEKLACNWAKGICNGGGRVKSSQSGETANSRKALKKDDKIKRGE